MRKKILSLSAFATFGALCAAPVVVSASDVQQGEKPVFVTPVAGIQADGGSVIIAVDSSGKIITSGSSSVSAAPPTTATPHTPGVCIASLSDGGSTTLLASNTARQAMYLSAPSSNTDKIWLVFGTGATVDGGNGVPLTAGQTINDDTGAIYTGTVSFIPNSGSQSACAVEL